MSDLAANNELPRVIPIGRAAQEEVETAAAASMEEVVETRAGLLRRELPDGGSWYERVGAAPQKTDAGSEQAIADVAPVAAIPVADAPAPSAPPAFYEPIGAPAVARPASAPDRTTHPIRVVSAEALRHNLALLRRLAGEDAAIWPAVKADAYGHGLIDVVRALEAAPASDRPDAYCVARVEEAMRLRDSGYRGRLLVLAPVVEPLPLGAVSAGLEVVVCDRMHLEVLRRSAVAGTGNSWAIGVHLKIDSGMGRMGCRTDRAIEMLADIGRTPGVKLRGIMTHFARADEPDNPDGVAATHNQRKAFETTLREIARWMAERRPEWAEAMATGKIVRHAANSGGLFWHRRTRFDAVRPGLALYGIAPGGNVAPWNGTGPTRCIDNGSEIDGTTAAAALRPALRVEAPVLGIDDAESPDGSFRRAAAECGGGFGAQPGALLLRVGIGTEHGYPSRAAGSGVTAEVAGRGLPVIAVGARATWLAMPHRASRDEIATIASATRATMISDGTTPSGNNGAKADPWALPPAPTAADLAFITDTIAYEITTALRAPLWMAE